TKSSSGVVNTRNGEVGQPSMRLTLRRVGDIDRATVYCAPGNCAISRSVRRHAIHVQRILRCTSFPFIRSPSGPTFGRSLPRFPRWVFSSGRIPYYGRETSLFRWYPQLQLLEPVHDECQPIGQHLLGRRTGFDHQKTAVGRDVIAVVESVIAFEQE